MTPADFIADITADPGVAFYREVFADWLDEFGLPGQAEGQRWAARHGTWATRNGRRASPSVGWFGGAGSGRSKLPRLFFKAHRDFDMLYGTGRGESTTDMLRGHERNFLARCAELAWGPDGEPIGELKG